MVPGKSIVQRSRRVNWNENDVDFVLQFVYPDVNLKQSKSERKRNWGEATPIFLMPICSFWKTPSSHATLKTISLKSTRMRNGPRRLSGIDSFPFTCRSTMNIYANAAPILKM